MTEERPSFSLLDEPWIPCLMMEGSGTELSLLEVLENPGRIRSLAGELAVMDFALLRLLWAIMYGALYDYIETVDDWDELRGGGFPAKQITAYLEERRDRFDLLHPTRPFFQVAGLHTAKNEFSGLERLILDVPNGAPYQTNRGGGGLERIGFAEAARWLVTAQAYEPSGIKSGIVGDTRTKGGRGYPIGTGWAGRLGGVFVEGQNLEETLWLNFVSPAVRSEITWSVDDMPVWDLEPQQPGVDPNEKPYGPASLYTWQSRRILLAGDESGITGVLIGNGDPLEQHNKQMLEPLSRWRRSAPQEKKLGLPTVYMPRSHDPARALWRGAASVLPLGENRGKTGGEAYLPSLGSEWLAKLRVEDRLGPDHPVRIRAVGLSYGVQDAVVDEQVDDFLMVELATLASTDPQLRADIDKAIESTDAGVLALKKLARNLARAEGRESTTSADAAAADAYAQLESMFRQWLLALPPTSIADAVPAWRHGVKRLLLDLGGALAAAASPTAMVGREHQGTLINAPKAEAWFRAELNKVLPYTETSLVTAEQSGK